MNKNEGFPVGSVGKESTCNAGDTAGEATIPGSGRSTGVGNGNPFQYSCLGNSWTKSDTIHEPNLTQFVTSSETLNGIRSVAGNISVYLIWIYFFFLAARTPILYRTAICPSPSNDWWRAYYCWLGPFTKSIMHDCCCKKQAALKLQICSRYFINGQGLPSVILVRRVTKRPLHT